MNDISPSPRRILRDIAHARAGDKDNTSSVCVWTFRPEDYPDRESRAYA